MNEPTIFSQPEKRQPPPPTSANPRFILELEFVLSLANPYYLSHLAVNYPHLLGTSTADDDGGNDDIEGAKSGTSALPSTTNNTSTREAQAFTSYLAYLYSYWKMPEYSQFLTHPGATLRALRLLQEERFRKDIIRPQVIEALLGGADDAVEGEGLEGGQATETGPAMESIAQQGDESNGTKT
jgi:mediator of RNA polymerase II transcription subunit 31